MVFILEFTPRIDKISSYQHHKNEFIYNYAYWTMETHIAHYLKKEVTISDLLKFSPYGTLEGCGGTSDFVAHVLRNQVTKDEFIRIANQHDDFEYHCVDAQKFNLSQFSLVIEEIQKRLKMSGYVKFTFDNKGDENKQLNFMQVLMRRNSKMQQIFDHSFVLVALKTDLDIIIRIESYQGNYAPRAIQWNNYFEDIKCLFIDSENIANIWNRVFQVICDGHYQREKIEVIIES